MVDIFGQLGAQVLRGEQFENLTNRVSQATNQLTQVVNTPNLLSSTLGSNASMITNLLGGTAIGGAIPQLSNLTGALGGIQGALGGLQGTLGGLGGLAGGGGLEGITGQLTGLLGGGGSNPFAGMLGGLAGMEGGLGGLLGGLGGMMGGMGGEGGRGGAGAGGGFQPNVLSSIDQPAYHFRFVCLPDLAAQAVMNGQLEALSDALIITETGASKYNITEVELTGYVGPNFSSKNANITNGVIKITEPYGAGFLDTLYAASGQLGLSNWTKATYFLEIKFHGYDPGSGQYVDQLAEKTVIPCKIINLDVDINESGAKYVMEIVNHDDFATMSHHGFLNQGFSPGVETTQDFFTRLKQTLEQNQLTEYGVVRHIYNFVIHELPQDFDIMNIGTSPSTWMTTSPDQSMQPNRSQDMGGVQGKSYVAANLGEAIKSLATQVFSNTLEGQKLISRSEDPTKPSNQAHNMVIWKVQSQTRLRSDGNWYSFEYDDYNYEVTYHIVPHVAFGGIMSIEQRTDSSNQELIAQKMAKMQQLQRLSKEYKYLFTGENTEVINFDIKSNLAWFGYVPPLTGAGGVAKSTSTPPLMSQEQFDMQTNPSAAIASVQSGLTQQIMGLATGLLGNNNAAIEALRGQHAENAIAAIQGMGLGEGQGRLASGGGGTYIEDLPIQGEKLIPVSFNSDKDKTEGEYIGDAESSIQAGQEVYAMMIAQIFGAKAAFMELDITIRGDPYWLGNIGKSPGPGQGSADYFLGDNAVKVEFYFPGGIDEATGAPILAPANLFSGIFIVHTVVNKFSSGKFTQQLLGYRNMNTALQIGAQGGAGGEQSGGRGGESAGLYGTPGGGSEEAMRSGTHAIPGSPNSTTTTRLNRGEADLGRAIQPTTSNPIRLNGGEADTGAATSRVVLNGLNRGQL